MVAKYAQHVSTRVTPQSEPIPNKPMVANSAGGYSFGVDCWKRMERFLILGNEGGSYYASEKKLTQENAKAVLECATSDINRAVNLIVTISDAGRAPKNDPAIFALAMLSKYPQALEAVPKVCRIGTHLFHFVEAAKSFRGRGRAFNRALQRWYLSKTPQELCHQLAKYQSRDSWSHRDVLRLCKPKGTSEQCRAFRWAVGKTDSTMFEGLELLGAFEAAKRSTSKQEIVSLIEQHNLPRECVPTEWLNHAEVWEALLAKMPYTAMIRNLAKMTAVGLIKPLSNAVSHIVTKLRDVDSMRKARVHPLAILVAQNIYAQGRGDKGSLTWQPVPQVIDALDKAFYDAFKAIEPTGKRFLLGLDVSGSMTSGTIAGMPGITPRVGSAAMSLVTAATEPNHAFVAFSDRIIPLALSARQRLNDACATMDGIPFGRTDCAQPMIYAQQNKIPVDVFVIYTDSETWFGSIHPVQALQQYRERMGIGAKLVVVGMVSNGFSIADPSDAGMLDVVGFDTAVPAVMADFATN